MEGVLPGGHRRIDRILGEDYLAGLSALPLAEVRLLRDEADQEETDLSYLRRMLQGRVDLIRAEMDRRTGTGAPEVVADLARLLGDGERPPPRGLGRHRATDPEPPGTARRWVEGLIADAKLSDPQARTDDELAAAARLLTDAERQVSERRRAVQGVLDAVSADITRRYRDGEADVDALLPGAGGSPAGS